VHKHLYPLSLNLKAFLPQLQTFPTGLAVGTANTFAVRLRKAKARISRPAMRATSTSGALPVHRLGRSVRISEADISAFLAANRSL